MEKSKVFNTRLVNEITEKMERGVEFKPKDIPWFEGQIGIRKADISFAPTPSERDEYIACAVDILEFAKRCRIKSEDGAFHQLSLRDYQTEILETINTRQKTIIMASRQCGKCCNPLTQLTIKKGGITQDTIFWDLWYSNWKADNKLKSFKIKSLYYIKNCLIQLLKKLD